MEVMHAVFSGHQFPRHFHDTYVIQVVEAGADQFECAGHDFQATSGQVVLINPGEVHTGKSAGDKPLRYRSFYPDAAALSEITGGPLPWFSSTVVSDRKLACDLAHAHQALVDGVCQLGGQTRFIEALGRLIALHDGSQLPRVTSDDQAVDSAKAILSERYAAPPSLRELAYECGYSSYHLLRLFRKRVGVPPYEFLNVVRVERSKSLLRKGMRPADVALSVGYADQAHLTRQFKRLVGVTPGRFRN